MYTIITWLANIVTNFISSTGYWGIAICMTIESCNIPLPSEVILPFGGYMVSEGYLRFFDAAMAGTIGGTFGSIISYYLGRFAMDSPKLFWISQKKRDTLTDFFNRHGESTVFFARLLPMIRTFISLPAGAARMNMSKFIIYTFIGSLLWSLLLTYLGYQLGSHWVLLRNYFEYIDIAILAVIAMGIIYYFAYYRKKPR